MRIAVTGASGRVGGQVVRLLAADDEHDVLALVRRTTVYELASARVTAGYADYTDPASLRAALHGVDVLVFVSSDGASEQVLRHHENVVQAAADCGVGHVVALSGLDADVDSPFCYAAIYGHTERLLAATPCAVSIARASIFAEFFQPWLTEAATTGELRLPAADGRVSLVSRSDVGRCLAALAVSPPSGRCHELTGPEALDLPTIATLTAAASRTPVEYVDVTPQEHCVEMARAGESAWWMYAYSSMFESIRDHRWESVSDEVLQLTGRRPAALPDLLAPVSRR